MSKIRLRKKTELYKLRSHITGLKTASWMDSGRSWWPDYLFHCTDILNVANILRSGELLSRTQARCSNNLLTDIAAPGVIDATSLSWQDYVRLYFRPKTPTQYRNEGFRPIEKIEMGAHCPVPVYVLFDSMAVLSRRDSRFTDGNLAGGGTPKSAIDDLCQMPFQFIYHNGSFMPDEKSSIVYHRNAEVLIPQRLDLQSVQHILCRSPAEYDTLRNLLPIGALNRWGMKIGIIPKWSLFHSVWTFVQQVDLNDERILVTFNANTRTPGPFNARLEVQRQLAKKAQINSLTKNEFHADKKWKITLRQRRDVQEYRARLYLDDNLAYEGRYQDYRLPF